MGIALERSGALTPMDPRAPNVCAIGRGFSETKAMLRAPADRLMTLSIGLLAQAGVGSNIPDAAGGGFRPRRPFSQRRPPDRLATTPSAPPPQHHYMPLGCFSGPAYLNFRRLACGVSHPASPDGP